jgi:predicted MFS family arabinose efflux permease
MVTTEIVGPEKMVEGFGFMLFCQSYSNVMGPPLSGTLSLNFTYF